MYKPVQAWIKKDPVISFFVTAIAICYATLFPAIYFVLRDNTIGQIIGYYLSSIGTYSPAIAAIIITRLIQPDRSSIPHTRKFRILVHSVSDKQEDR